MAPEFPCSWDRGCQSHHAVPREIGTTVVAVPTQRRHVELPMGEVRFVKRDVGKLDIRLAEIDLGQILPTTPEQTAYDLLMRPKLGTTLRQAHAAVENLRPQIDSARFRALIVRKRGNAVIQEFERTLDRASVNARRATSQSPATCRRRTEPRWRRPSADTTHFFASLMVSADGICHSSIQTGYVSMAGFRPR